MRIASANDAELLAALHARAFDRPWSADDLSKLLENSTAFAVVAESSAPQGFVLGWSPGATAEILTLAVAPEFRRVGIGLALVNAAVAAALVRGAHEMILEVADDNTAARALYKKLGFSESGRRRDYYQRDTGATDALVLRRDLPRPQV